MPLVCAGFNLDLSQPDETWDLSFRINGEDKVILDDVPVPHNYSVSVRNWMLDGYVPPLVDPFHPYRSQTVIRDVEIPLLKVKGFEIFIIHALFLNCLKINAI